jgi:hypothetical protein
MPGKNARQARKSQEIDDDAFALLTKNKKIEKRTHSLSRTFFVRLHPELGLTFPMVYFEKMEIDHDNDECWINLFSGSSYTLIVDPDQDREDTLNPAGTSAFLIKYAGSVFRIYLKSWLLEDVHGLNDVRYIDESNDIPFANKSTNKNLTNATMKFTLRDISGRVIRNVALLFPANTESLVSMDAVSKNGMSLHDYILELSFGVR